MHGETCIKFLYEMWLVNNDNVHTAADCDVHHQSTYILVTTEPSPIHMHNHCSLC